MIMIIPRYAAMFNVQYTMCNTIQNATIYYILKCIQDYGKI